MKVLLVVLDGAADRRDQRLGFKTPLQAASLGSLNQLSKAAAMGMMYPIDKDTAPESDAAVYSILGYDIKDYTGRGPLEAYGAGLDIDDKTLAIRCNFATKDIDDNLVEGSRVESEEAAALEEEINKIELGIGGISFEFRTTVGHRAVCAFHSQKEKLSPNVSNTDPDYVKKGSISVAVKNYDKKVKEVVPLDAKAGSKKSAKVLNTFIEKAGEVLAKSKVNKRRKAEGKAELNLLLVKDAGVGLPKVQSIQEKYGITSAFIAEMPVEIGISKLLGMAPIKLEWISDRFRRYEKMAELIKENKERFDLIYVNIKGPDEPSHDGDIFLKKQVLEDIEGGFFVNIKELVATICVTADHATPSTMRVHTSDPVPVMIRYKDRKYEDGLLFDENIGERGSLRTITGSELLKKLLS